jgi:phytanoyl-CoA hydroxylase
MPISSLSDTIIHQFTEQGFATLPRVISSETCKNLRKRAQEIVEEFDPKEAISIFTTHDQTRVSDEYFLSSGDKVRSFFEEEAFDEHGNLRQSKQQSINKIGHALHRLDPVFRAFSEEIAVEHLARQLGMQSPQCVQSMYIFKQPHIGGEVTCHQDSTFLYTEPMSVIGFWFALEDARLDNGCLWAIPGGHRTSLQRKFVRLPKGGTTFEELGTHTWDSEQLVPLEVPEGTLIVLHGLLPHLSYANRSPQSRHAYAIHAIDQTCSYPETNWLRYLS